jgi:hypothetical protein
MTDTIQTRPAECKSRMCLVSDVLRTRSFFPRRRPLARAAGWGRGWKRRCCAPSRAPAAQHRPASDLRYLLPSLLYLLTPLIVRTRMFTACHGAATVLLLRPPPFAQKHQGLTHAARPRQPVPSLPSQPPHRWSSVSARQELHRIIHEELDMGVHKPESKKYVLDQIKELRRRGAQSIVLVTCSPKSAHNRV